MRRQGGGTGARSGPGKQAARGSARRPGEAGDQGPLRVEDLPRSAPCAYGLRGPIATERRAQDVANAASEDAPQGNQRASQRPFQDALPAWFRPPREATISRSSPSTGCRHPHDGPKMRPYPSPHLRVDRPVWTAEKPLNAPSEARIPGHWRRSAERIGHAENGAPNRRRSPVGPCAGFPLLGKNMPAERLRIGQSNHRGAPVGGLREAHCHAESRTLAGSFEGSDPGESGRLATGWQGFGWLNPWAQRPV